MNLRYTFKCLKWIFGIGPDPYEVSKKKVNEEKTEPEPPVESPDEPDEPDEEIWRDTKYKGYQVSNLGRIRNKRGKLITMRQGKYFAFYSNGQVLTGTIRTLVADAFLDKPDIQEDKTLIITHINGDINDCRASNLRYTYEGKDDFAAEEWRTIDKFPNYEISNRGRGRRKAYVNYQGKHIEPKVLKMNRKCYFGFYAPGEKSHYRVDELVAEAFLEKPDINDDEFLYVHHFDGCGSNNYVENLEWRILSKGMSKPAYRIKGDNDMPEPKTEPMPEPKIPAPPRIKQSRLSGEFVRDYIDIDEIIETHPDWYADDIEESIKTNEPSYGYFWRYADNLQT